MGNSQFKTEFIGREGVCFLFTVKIIRSLVGVDTRLNPKESRETNEFAARRKASRRIPSTDNRVVSIGTRKFVVFPTGRKALL